MPDLQTVIADLADEHRALDDVVAPLDDDQWKHATASPGWSVADQIGHLTYFDHAAATAISDPDAFDTMKQALVESVLSGSSEQYTLGSYRQMEPTELLDAWRSHRDALLAAASQLADGDRVPWYGPSMGAKSFLTARLMETWAHGQDIVDATGAVRPATDRLRHIAQLGVITRGWSYVNRGEAIPPGGVRVVLRGPTGEVWTYGADDADSDVSGPAEDFCLVVTQRRNVADTDLVIRGELARDWLEKAQAFAGPPTDAPPPSRRA